MDMYEIDDFPTPTFVKLVSFCDVFFCFWSEKTGNGFREGESGSGRQRQDMEPLGCGLRMLHLTSWNMSSDFFAERCAF